MSHDDKTLPLVESSPDDDATRIRPPSGGAPAASSPPDDRSGTQVLAPATPAPADSRERARPASILLALGGEDARTAVPGRRSPRGSVLLALAEPTPDTTLAPSSPTASPTSLPFRRLDPGAAAPRSAPASLPDETAPGAAAPLRPALPFTPLHEGEPGPADSTVAGLAAPIRPALPFEPAEHTAYLDGGPPPAPAPQEATLCLDGGASAGDASPFHALTPAELPHTGSIQSPGSAPRDVRQSAPRDVRQSAPRDVPRPLPHEPAAIVSPVHDRAPAVAVHEPAPVAPPAAGKAPSETAHKLSQAPREQAPTRHGSEETPLGLLPIEVAAAIQVEVWRGKERLNEILARSGVDEATWDEHCRLRDRTLRDEVRAGRKTLLDAHYRSLLDAARAGGRSAPRSPAPHG